MAKGSDREHFDDYREQTQVKHNILSAYLPAYFNILKGSSKSLVYVDGFAGPGSYFQSATDKTFDGSPILALRLISGDTDFSKQVSTIFIESDPLLFDKLKRTVNDFYEEHPEIRKPVCRFGSFADRLTEILDKGKLGPTFLFVDPCGVSGTSFETIRAVMKIEKSEAFIFFNIDGVRRIAGLPALSPVLVDLMGSEGRATLLYERLRITGNVLDRERIILSEYCNALAEDIGAKYVIPFRVEREDQKKASHYLIHATKHPLGFRIMKDVMWRRGHGGDTPGGLELTQKSRTNYVPLFDKHAHIKDDILETLKGVRVRVSTFYEDWTMRPADMQCEAAYREALLELEKDGIIEVLGKDGRNVVTADARPKRKNKGTLAKDYYVRLKK